MNRGLYASGKRILIAAYEVCSEGGASTSAYELFRKMQATGLDVHLVNIIDERDFDYFKYISGESVGNPDRLDDIHNCVLNQAKFFTNPLHTGLPGLLTDIMPDVAIGIDCLPALMLKKSLPDTQVIFLACGSEQARLYIRTGKARDAISLQKSLAERKKLPPVFVCREAEAMQSCDLMLANSRLTLDLCRYFYPMLAGKIGIQSAWFAEWICDGATRFKDLGRPFAEREIDVLFIASSWMRKVKNYPLAKRIISDCQDIEICIVGRSKRENRYAKNTGFIGAREDIFSLMGNARTVISTSVLDTAPDILFEAAVMGCNVVASANCGNWRLCHDDLLVESYRRKDFVHSIRLATEKKYADRLDAFLELKCYRNLLDTVAVI